MKKTTTNRNFIHYEFKDRNDEKCSLQQSSIATEPCIWLGVDDANPQVMVSDARKLGLSPKANNGWAPFEIPKEVLLTTRMHLTREQVKTLLPILENFVLAGKIEDDVKEDRKMMIEFLVGDQWHELTKLTGMQYPPEGRVSSFKKFALVAIEVDKSFGPRITAYRITEKLEKE